MIEGVAVASSPYRAHASFEQRSCASKKRLASRGDARRAARYVRERGEGIVQPYPCHFCRGWHVGHPLRPQRPWLKGVIWEPTTW